MIIKRKTICRNKISPSGRSEGLIGLEYVQQFVGLVWVLFGSYESKNTPLEALKIRPKRKIPSRNKP